MGKIPLLVIGGATATGKSAVAVDLAQQLDGEIVSADSMQVYKYMDIGTAKVSQATRAVVPHHMLDVVEPDQHYSLGLYQQQAFTAIKEIWSRGKLPIMTGGTGLYIRAVTENYPLAEMPHDAHCRQEIDDLWDQRGEEYVFQLLQAVDPETASKVKDRRRIVRALEVYRLTGRAMSDIQNSARDNNPFVPWVFTLSLPREDLYRQINQRAKSMVINGLIGEYTSLMSCYPTNCPAMQGLGYRHCGLYVRGEWSKAEMLEHLQRDTRRYAKRQLTWFRGMTSRWLDNSEPSSVVEKIYQFVQENTDSYAN